MSSELTAAAEAVCDALRRHVAATDGRTEDRPAAGAALVEALDRYGVAAVNAGSELPDEYDALDGWLGEVDDVEYSDEELPLTDATNVVGCFS